MFAHSVGPPADQKGRRTPDKINTYRQARGGSICIYDWKSRFARIYNNYIIVHRINCGTLCLGCRSRIRHLMVEVASSNLSRCRDMLLYCSCAALRVNVASRIWNRVSPAESVFSARIGSGLSQSTISIFRTSKEAIYITRSAHIHVHRGLICPKSTSTVCLNLVTNQLKITKINTF